MSDKATPPVQSGRQAWNAAGRGSGSHSNHSTARGGSQLLYDARGRRVGCVRDGAMCVTIHSSKGHILQRWPGPGLAFNLEVLARAWELGAQVILITDADKSRQYRAGMSQMAQNGIDFNFGYGAQRCLPLQFWITDDKTTEQPRQLGLCWGETT